MARPWAWNSGGGSGGGGGGSLPDLDPSPAGDYPYPSSVTLDAKGRATAAVAGTKSPVNLSVLTDFGSGGSIATWQLGPIISSTVTYAPFGNVNEGVNDQALVYAAQDGDVLFFFDYASSTAVNANFRLQALDGTWSRLKQVALPSGSQRLIIPTTLLAGQALGIHIGTGGVIYTRFKAGW